MFVSVNSSLYSRKALMKVTKNLVGRHTQNFLALISLFMTSPTLTGLSGEKLRWTMQSKAFKEQLTRLVGDVLLSTAFLSYSGPFNQEFRGTLLQTWKGLLKNRNIPYTNSIDVVNMLVDTVDTSEWALQGLPNDELSMQNAAIVTKAQSYPLLIDPQGQGKIWIKTKEQYNDLQVSYVLQLTNVVNVVVFF